MTAIGILMIEHRLIESMTAIMSNELSELKNSNKPKPDFIGLALDFIRTYADKFHHGKEEDVFFELLLTKRLAVQDRKYIHELIEEHKQGRKRAKDLESAKQSYLNGSKSGINKIRECMNWLVKFYPKHIKKEDAYFFSLYKTYLNDKEQDKMLLDFLKFNKGAVHEKYLNMVVDLERKIDS